MSNRIIDNNLFMSKIFNLITLFNQYRKTEFLQAGIVKLHIEEFLKVIEVEDCGSHGGFSDGQKNNSSLSARLSFLIKKNNIEITKKQKDGLKNFSKYS